MSKTNKGLFSLCIPLLTLLLLFVGCKETPGSVGNDYIKNPELTFDTLSISDTEFESFSSYSGQLAFIPIGYYSDPLFGEVETIGMIKPVRRPSVIDEDSIELGNFYMQLELALDSVNTYGDTLSESSFTLYPITSDWRGTTYRINSELTYDESNPVGSFSIGQEKNVIVDNISDAWVDEYEVYLNDSSLDSAYKYDFKGLAIVPDNNTNKISFSLAGSSRFLIINEAETDTVNTDFNDWAFVLNRSGAVETPIAFPLHSSLEGMFKFSLAPEVIEEFVEGRNLIRAELLFYEAREELENALPENHNRLVINGLNMDYVESNDPEYEYQFGQVDYRGSRDGDSNVFKFNMTGYVNNVVYGSEDEDELILGLGSNSGALRSTLIYNGAAPDSLVPKLIFTTLAGE